MQKKLTITLDERVYEGLYNAVGRRRISRFVESLVRPHVIGKDLETVYRRMAGSWEMEGHRSLRCPRKIQAFLPYFLGSMISLTLASSLES